MYDYMGYGMGGYMGLLWIVPVLLIIWVAYVVLESRKEQDKSAMDILKDRYAKGEIDQKEFEQKSRDLQV